jgi:hypothetical protein
MFAARRSKVRVPRRPLLAFFFLMTFLSSGPTQAATVSWILDGDGNWNSASNWSSNPSLPGPSDDVVISQPGFDTITLSSIQGVNSLNCDETLQIAVGSQLSLASDSQINGSLSMSSTLANAGTLTIGGTFSWNGSLLGAGKTTLAAGSTTTICNSSTAALAEVLENSGIVNFTPANSTIAFNFVNGTFNNLAGGVFNFVEGTNAAAVTIFSNQGGSVFNNAGTFNYTAFRTTPQTHTIAVPFNNSGVTNVYAGTLTLSGGGANSGTMNIYPEGNFALSSTTFTNTGALNFNGTTTATGFTTFSTSLFANAAGGHLNVVGGGLSLTGSGTNSGVISAAAGTTLTIDTMPQAAGSSITGAGSVTLSNISSFSGTLNVSGPLTFLSTTTLLTDQTLPSPVTLGSSSSIGTITGSGNVTISGQLNWSNGTMTGTGKTTLAVTALTTLGAASGPSALNLNRVLDNAGTVNYVIPASGALSLSTSGVLNNLAGATFNVTSSSTGSITAFSGNAGTINNAGTMNFNGASSSSTMTSSAPLNNSGTLNLNLGALAGSFTLTNTGTINVMPDVGLGGSVTNNGALNFTGGTSVFGVGSFTNSPTGHVNVLAGSLTLTGTNSNSGNINVMPGAQLSINGNYQQLAGSSITGGGSVAMVGITFAGNLGVTGPITLAGPVTFATDQSIAGPVSITTGLLGAGNITFTNSFTFTGNAVWSGSGKMSVASTATGSINLPGSLLTLSRLLENAGTINISTSTTPPTLAFSDGSLSNLASGTLNFNSTAVTTAFTSSGNSSLNNAGTVNVRLTPSFGTGNLNDGVPLTNSGTVNLNAGTFSLTGGGTNSGAINVYPGSAFTVGTQSFSNIGNINYITGTNAVSVSSQFNNASAGHINVQGGTLTITGIGAANAGNLNVAAGATLQINSDYTQLAGSTITGPGTLSIGGTGITNFSGAVNSTGPIQISAPVTFNANQNLVGTTTLASTLSGTGDVLLTGPFVWVSGTMSGTGKTTLPADHVLNLNGGAAQILDGRTFINSGTVNLANLGSQFATLAGVNGAVFNNQSGAVFDALGNGNLTWTTGTQPTFNNAGLLEKTGGGQTTLSWILSNTGVVQIQSGILNVGGGGADTGAYSIATGATLAFTGGTRNLNVGSTVAGPGTLTVSGGTVNFNAGSSLTTTGVLTISSGTLNITNSMLSTPAQVLLTGGGILNVTGDKNFDNLVWTGGTFGGSGTTTTIGSAFDFSGDGTRTLSTRTLKNLGTITWSGAGWIGGSSSAVIQNLTGSTFDVQNDETMSYASGTNPTFNNAGLFKKSAGTGVTSVVWTFNNSGTVQIQTGTLSFAGDGSHTGSFDVAAGAMLDFAGGTHHLAGTASITGSGAVTVTGATLDITGDDSFSDFAWTAGSITGAGTTTVVGGSISGNSTKSLGRTLVNSGTINWTGGPINGGVINNMSGATFNDQDGPSLNPGSGATFNNSGTFVKAGNSQTNVFWLFNNPGATEIEAGTLSLTGGVSQLSLLPGSSFAINGGTWHVFDGASLSLPGIGVNPIIILQQAASVQLSGPTSAFNQLGQLATNNGTFQIDSGRNFTTAGDFGNNGTLIVGAGSTFTVPAGNTLTNTGLIQGAGTIAANVQSSGSLSPGMSPGALTFSGGLTLQNGSQSIFELAGPQPGVGYDHIAVNGNLALAGSLHVSFVGGFQSQIQRTDAFDLFTATGAISGAFDVTSGSRLFTTDGIGSFLLSYPAEADSKSVVLSDFLARGDFDRHGTATTADISAMLGALSDLSLYKSSNSLTDDELSAIGDLDGSGSVNNADLQKLINLVANATASNSSSAAAQAVPEPPAIILVSAFLLALATMRRIAATRPA